MKSSEQIMLIASKEQIVKTVNWYQVNKDCMMVSSEQRLSIGIK